jgi:2-oxoglutarate ferredoxin oxidoreductase subunit gamma
MIKQIRLSGSGGQGVILIGDIIAEAASVYEKKNVALNTSYGGQVRGGSSQTEVLIGDVDEEIEYPEVTEADILLAMSQDAMDKFGQNVKDSGMIIADSSYVTDIPETKATVHRFPITDIAREEHRNVLVSNMVALGYIIGISEIASVEAVEWAIEKKAPKGTAEINKKAFLLSFESARKVR